MEQQPADILKVNIDVPEDLTTVSDEERQLLGAKNVVSNLISLANKIKDIDKGASSAAFGFANKVRRNPNMAGSAEVQSMLSQMRDMFTGGILAPETFSRTAAIKGQQEKKYFANYLERVQEETRELVNPWSMLQPAGKSLASMRRDSNLFSAFSGEDYRTKKHAADRDISLQNEGTSRTGAIREQQDLRLFEAFRTNAKQEAAGIDSGLVTALDEIAEAINEGNKAEDRRDKANSGGSGRIRDNSVLPSPNSNNGNVAAAALQATIKTISQIFTATTDYLRTSTVEMEKLSGQLFTMRNVFNFTGRIKSLQDLVETENLKGLEKQRKAELGDLGKTEFRSLDPASMMLGEALKQKFGRGRSQFLKFGLMPDDKDDVVRGNMREADRIRPKPKEERISFPEGYRNTGKQVVNFSTQDQFGSFAAILDRDEQAEFELAAGMDKASESLSSSALLTTPIFLPSFRSLT